MDRTASKENVLKIISAHFGQIEVEENELITFPEGVVGFEKYERFVLLSNPEEEPFQWLQSVDDPDVAFVLIEPLLVRQDYDFEVDDETIQLLDIQDPGQLRLFVIVTMHSDFSKITGNLLAPILLNLTNRRAHQIIIQNSSYSLREPLFTESEGEAQNG